MARCMAVRRRSDTPPAQSAATTTVSGADNTNSRAETTNSGAESADGLSFEVALEQLEAIVDRLEQGDLALEDALRAFEAGVGLTRRCAKQLTDAERRIEVLVREGESWLARPFEEPEEAE
jgi:exodeoxyribonuclease VII small subunit